MDFISTQFQIAYVKETPPESIRLMNNIKKQKGSCHESGECLLQSGSQPVAIIGESTNCYIVAEKPITIALSTGEVFTEMEIFCYSSKKPISVSIQNQSNSENRVVYASGRVVHE